MTEKTHSQRSVTGIVGGVVAAAVGALLVVSTVAMIDAAVRDGNVLAILVLGTATIGGLVGLAIFGLGIAAILDARGKQNGASAGRLWSLFGFFGLLSVAGLFAEPSVELGVAAATLLLIATPNFLAWRNRTSPATRESQKPIRGQ